MKAAACRELPVVLRCVCPGLATSRSQVNRGRSNQESRWGFRSWSPKMARRVERTGRRCPPARPGWTPPPASFTCRAAPMRSESALLRTVGASRVDAPRRLRPRLGRPDRARSPPPSACRRTTIPGADFVISFVRRAPPRPEDPRSPSTGRRPPTQALELLMRCRTSPMFVLHSRRLTSMPPAREPCTSSQSAVRTGCLLEQLRVFGSNPPVARVKGDVGAHRYVPLL